MSVDPEKSQAGDADAKAITPRYQLGEKKSLRDRTMWRVSQTVETLYRRGAGWRKLIHMYYLPLASSSGLKYLETSKTGTRVLLPFKRFNRNWYNAMAGGALLGNAEVAAGMFLFQILGTKWTMVCRHMDVKFRLPCFGNAIYDVTPRGDLDELTAPGREFDLTLDMKIYQQGKGGEKDRRIGGGSAVFHLMPWEHYVARKKAKAKG